MSYFNDAVFRTMTNSADKIILKLSDVKIGLYIQKNCEIIEQK